MTAAERVDSSAAATTTEPAGASNALGQSVPRQSAVGRGLAWAGGSGGRISGLDLARAAALIGMFAAHVGDAGTRGPSKAGWHWLWVADGRPSALFAVLAGVTISLLVSRDAAGPAHAAVRIGVRGAVLVLAGYALDALGTPVDVILTNLGLMFIIVLPAIRWRPSALAVVGVAVMVVGGLQWPHVMGVWDGIPIAEKFTSINYPAMAWTGYLLVGMAVGRLRLRDKDVQRRLMWVGTLVAGAAYGSGVLRGASAPWKPLWFAERLRESWFSIAPHSNTPLELLGNTGVALLVIGVCLWISRPRAWLLPALAFGSMSLTMYTAHLLVIVAVGTPMVSAPSNTALVAMTASLMALATAWRLALGVGPLERALTWISTAVADLAVRGARKGSRV